jgi:hypothetical protein
MSDCAVMPILCYWVVRVQVGGMEAKSKPEHAG